MNNPSIILIVLAIVCSISLCAAIGEYLKKLYTCNSVVEYNYYGFFFLSWITGMLWGVICCKPQLFLTGFLCFAGTMLLTTLAGRTQKRKRILYFILQNLIFFGFFIITALLISFFIKIKWIMFLLALIIVSSISNSVLKKISRLFVAIDLEDQLFNAAYTLKSNPKESFKTQATMRELRRRLSQLWEKKLSTRFQRTRRCLALGKKSAARNGYRRLLTKIQRVRRITGDLQPFESLCLAGLGASELLYRNTGEARKHFFSAYDSGTLSEDIISPETIAAVRFLAAELSHNNTKNTRARNVFLHYFRIDSIDESDPSFNDISQALENLAEIKKNGTPKSDKELVWLNSKIAEYRPDFFWAHGNIGFLAFKQGNYDEAFACFSRAHAVNPKFEKAVFFLAKISLVRGELSKAEGTFRQCLSLNDNNAEAHFELGRILIEKVHA